MTRPVNDAATLVSLLGKGYSVIGGHCPRSITEELVDALQRANEAIAQGRGAAKVAAQADAVLNAQENAKREAREAARRTAEEEVKAEQAIAHDATIERKMAEGRTNLSTPKKGEK